jgi:hypothetical protein
VFSFQAIRNMTHNKFKNNVDRKDEYTRPMLVPFAVHNVDHSLVFIPIYAKKLCT